MPAQTFRLWLAFVAILSTLKSVLGVLESFDPSSLDAPSHHQQQLPIQTLVHLKMSGIELIVPETTILSVLGPTSTNPWAHAPLALTGAKSNAAAQMRPMSHVPICATWARISQLTSARSGGGVVTVGVYHLRPLCLWRTLTTWTRHISTTLAGQAPSHRCNCISSPARLAQCEVSYSL